MKMSYIREFVVLAETQNFSKAAEKLYIAQPALSRHIAMVEEELGGRLFDRNTRNVSLSPAGQAAYDSLKKALQYYDSARENVSLIFSGQAGALNISSPYYWTEDFIEPAIHRFSQLCPKSKVNMISCQPVEGFRDMLEGRADIAISLFADTSDDICCEPFATERLCAVMRWDNPLVHRDSIQLKELQELEDVDFVFLGSDAVNCGYASYNKFILSLLKARGIKPESIRYTPQIETLGMAISQSDGVCIMPYGVRHMDRSYIFSVLLEDADCSVPMSIYYRAGNGNLLIPSFVAAAKGNGGA